MAFCEFKFWHLAFLSQIPYSIYLTIFSLFEETDEMFVFKCVKFLFAVSKQLRAVENKNKNLTNCIGVHKDTQQACEEAKQ